MSIYELYSILLSDIPSNSIKNNEERIFELIPELRICKGFNQNNEWHVYDVYEHILHVIDKVQPELVLRLAALFHDVGKPKTYTEDEMGVGHFYGHWEESQKIFDEFAKRYNINSDLSRMVSLLIYYHDLNLSKQSNEELTNIYSLLGRDGIEYLYQIKKADLLAQNRKYHNRLHDYNEQKTMILSRFI